MKPHTSHHKTTVINAFKLWFVSGDTAVNEGDFKAPAVKQIKKSDTVLKCDQSIEVSCF